MGRHWLDESVLKGTVLIIGILEYFERTGYQYWGDITPRPQAQWNER